MILSIGNFVKEQNPLSGRHSGRNINSESTIRLARKRRARRENMISSIKAVTAAILFATAGLAAAQQIQVQVDGNNLAFTNAQPQYINGRVLVPMRGVFQQLGASVEWDRSTQQVTGSKGGSIVMLRIGHKHATVDGKDVLLDVPPM